MDDLLSLFQNLDSCDSWEEREKWEGKCLSALERQMRLATLRLSKTGPGGDALKEVLFQVAVNYFGNFYLCGLKRTR